MAVATVAPLDEVVAQNHNDLAGLVNGTSGYGQPVKLYDYNNASTYSVISGNQDTSNGLIHSFQYGTVGAATEVARVRKQGLDGRLLDKDGAVFHLDAYAASGITLRANQSDSAGIAALELTSGGTSAQLTANDTAWNAAIAAAQARGGGTIQLGPGVYIGPSSAVTLINNLVVRGAGIDVTIVKHRSAASAGWTSYTPVLSAFQLSDVMFCDLTVDGNRTNNNAGTGGYDNSEVSIDGDDCACIRVKVTNFNKNAITMAGARNSAINCRIDGPALTSFTAHPTTDYGGFYGIHTPASRATSYALVSGCVVSGTGNNGIAIGGDGCIIIGNIVYGTHRRDSPSGSAGGQIGFSTTITTVASDTGPRNCVAIGNHIGATTTTGNWAIGIELNCGTSLANPGYNLLAVGNTIYRQSSYGITIDDATRVRVIGNTIESCTLGGIGLGFATACTHIGIFENTIADTTAGGTGLTVANLPGTDYYNISDNTFVNNGTAGTAHYSDPLAAVNRHIWGNVAGSGTPPPNYIPTAVTINAGGLTVTAGGLTVTAGGLTVTAGGATVAAGNLVVTTGNLTVSAGTLTVTSGTTTLGGNLAHTGSNLGVFGTAATTKKTVTGSRGGNAALASLLTQLAAYGLLTDSSS